MEGGRCDVAFATGLLRPGWAGCDAALAAGLAQPAIVRARGVLECESERKSMSVAAGVWWRDVLGGMIRGLGGYCSGGASREASSCGGKGLCLFASVRSVIEYTPLKVKGQGTSGGESPVSPNLLTKPSKLVKREVWSGPRGHVPRSSSSRGRT